MLTGAELHPRSVKPERDDTTARSGLTLLLGHHPGSAIWATSHGHGTRSGGHHETTLCVTKAPVIKSAGSAGPARGRLRRPRILARQLPLL